MKGKVGVVPHFDNVEMKWYEPAEFYSACVGKGWQKLLLDLTEKLFYLGWDGKLSQVKEKFGGLRFYWQSNLEGLADSIAYDCIRIAEHDSTFLCEECGKYGQARGAGWVKTLCAACWKKENDK